LFARAFAQVLEAVLWELPAPDLATLRATCTYFVATGITENIARDKLMLVPRARELRPDETRGETYALALHFVSSQNRAAAQATALALGDYHGASLLVPGTSRVCPSTGASLEHGLYTFGRGFHGQLGQARPPDA
jgi:hypothetical protein